MLVFGSNREQYSSTKGHSSFTEASDIAHCKSTTAQQGTPCIRRTNEPQLTKKTTIATKKWDLMDVRSDEIIWENIVSGAATHVSSNNLR